MNYSCIVFSQRPNDAAAPRYCLFKAPVGEVQQWSTVPRLTPEDAGGVQRAKNDFKVRSIRKFLQDDPRNTIPTAIVITVAPGAYTLNVSATTITLTAENRDNIFVIDGQHRLFGMGEFDPNSVIPIVAILDATNEERAFQFIVINNKVSKVPTDHIRALSINFTDPQGEVDLEARLRTARLTLSRHVSYVGLADDSDESPFRGMVALPGKQEPSARVVVPAAIEASIAYIQSKRFKQLGDDESAYQLFLTIWATVKDKWPTQFGATSKLLTKVGLITMNRHIIDALDLMASFGDKPIDLGNVEDVTAAVAKVLSMQAPEFWSCEWTSAISDTKAVRDAIDAALKAIQQNLRDKGTWSQDVDLLKQV
jgi:DGQHR domain-containing protein